MNPAFPGASGAVAPTVFVGTLPDLALAFSRRAPRMAWLLGAGASAMSGIPTAGALITRFTRDLYAAEQGCNIEELDLGDIRLRKQLDRYSTAYPGCRQLVTLSSMQACSSGFTRTRRTEPG